MAPSIGAGYDWVWESGFSIGLGFGAQYKHIFAEAAATGRNNSESLPFGIRGIMPTGEFTIGWTM